MQRKESFFTALRKAVTVSSNLTETTLPILQDLILFIKEGSYSNSKLPYFEELIKGSTLDEVALNHAQSYSTVKATVTRHSKKLYSLLGEDFFQLMGTAGNVGEARKRLDDVINTSGFSIGNFTDPLVFQKYKSSKRSGKIDTKVEIDNSYNRELNFLVKYNRNIFLEEYNSLNLNKLHTLLAIVDSDSTDPRKVSLIKGLTNGK